MKLKCGFILSIVIVFFISGCTAKTPEYKIDSNIANLLNNYDLERMAVFKETDSSLIENNYKLQLRGVEMISSKGGSFSDYISLSLKEQLSQNDLIDKNSNFVIKSNLLINDVDIWGFSTGSYTIKVNFKIIKDKHVLFDKDISIVHEFVSHFIGQIAIENGIMNYPVAVQKLLNKFLSDEDFIKTIKK